MEFIEEGVCREASEGLAVKTSECFTFNNATVGAPPVECQTITICPPDIVSGGNGNGNIGKVRPQWVQGWRI